MTLKWRGNILSYNNNKTVKGEKDGFATYIFYGAPNTVSGYNTCASSSKGCRANCIFYSGMGAMKTVQNARIRRTKLYFEERDYFLTLVNKDIMSAIKHGERNDMIPTFRLDGTTDIGLARHFVRLYPNVQFYDYTKVVKRVKMAEKYDNWHITYSLSENTTKSTVKILLAGTTNIAIPFKVVPNIGDRLWGRKLVDGYSTDLRFLDGDNRIVCLKAGGRGRKSDSEFIVPDVETLLDRFSMVA
tara:strand:+ start:295 stop:1026 length:732 start_codon:yes stop_codon:yes gene_type:complete